MAQRNLIKKKMCALFFLVSFLFSGCSTLFQLPIQLISYIISVPIDILKMGASLIPVAAKYAPYALLFVSNEKSSDVAENSLICFGVESDSLIKICSLKGGTNCYLLDLSKFDSSRVVLGDWVQGQVLNDSSLKLLFGGENTSDYSKTEIISIYNKMSSNGISVGVVDDFKVFSDLDCDVC